MTAETQLELRPHQERAIKALRASLASGKRRPVLQAPTGFGKTVVAGKIISSAVERGKRVVLTVPAITLIDQTVDAIRRAGIARCGVIQAGHPGRDDDAPVQIASVQTLGCRGTRPAADLVLVDECHKLFGLYAEWMRDPAWVRVPFIGLSATPWTKTLGDLYDDLIIASTTADLIRDGYLAPFRAFGPKIAPDLSHVGTVAGDHNKGDLSDVMRDRAIVTSTVDTWIGKGEGRPTLVFCVNKPHANDVTTAFEAAGVRAGYCDAYTKREARNVLGYKLRTGELQVVVNIGTLTTGVDWPWVSCIMLARPTKSEMLYTQIIGRGLRTHPGKTDCLILDQTSTTQNLGLVTNICHSELHKKRDNPGMDSPGAPMKMCHECNCIVPVSTRICPACKCILIADTGVEVIDGELIDLTSEAEKREEKQRWHSMLTYIGAERGYKPGWIAMKYREKFGVWPSRMKKDALEPSVEVKRFVWQSAAEWRSKQA